MSFVRASITHAGAMTMGAARDAGGIVVLAFEVARALFPPTLDGRELVRNLYKMGYRSVPIVTMTALFVGALMVIQFAAFVKQYGATGPSDRRERSTMTLGVRGLWWRAGSFSGGLA